MEEINHADLLRAEQRSMEWLIYAFSRSKDGGCPHSRNIFLPDAWAWKPSYAETTGYLIENLLQFNPIFPEVQARIAHEAGNWLLNQQHSDGYYFSGLERTTPSVFNTAQILTGLDVLYRYSGDERYRISLQRACTWMFNNIDRDGSWSQGLYVHGFYSAYYARALWPLQYIDIHYCESSHASIMDKTLGMLMELAFPELTRSSGFFPGKSVYSHSLAYALEGFFELSLISGNDELMRLVLQNIYPINERVLAYHKLPGCYDPSGKPDDSFSCTTGQAQMVSLLLKMSHGFPGQAFEESAMLLLNQLMSWQIRSGLRGFSGGFTASKPFWGPYFPGRMVNWTNKFFLDACYQYKKFISSKKEVTNQ